MFFFHIKEKRDFSTILTMRNVANCTVCEMTLSMKNSPSLQSILMQSTETELTEKRQSPGLCVSHCLFVTPILVPWQITRDYGLSRV